jgi:serine/threonine protein phosphatase PrpC
MPTERASDLIKEITRQTRPPKAEDQTETSVEKTREKSTPFLLETGVCSREKKATGWKNQDSVLSEGRIAGVFDGLGGLKDGDKASRVAMEAVRGYLNGNFKGTDSVKNAELVMRSAIEVANLRVGIENKGRQKNEKMATTLSVVAFFTEKGTGRRKMALGQVGDSRVYRLRQGEMARLSPEDSIFTYLKSVGINIDDQDKSLLKKTLNRCLEEQGRTPIENESGEKTIANLRNSVTSVIKGDSIEPHVLTFNVENGDLILISTDGLHDNRTDKQIESRLFKQHELDPKVISADLADYGVKGQSDPNNEWANKPDDATVITIKIGRDSTGEIPDMTADVQIEEDEEDIEDMTDEVEAEAA